MLPPVTARLSKLAFPRPCGRWEECPARSTARRVEPRTPQHCAPRRRCALQFVRVLSQVGQARSALAMALLLACQLHGGHSRSGAERRQARASLTLYTRAGFWAQRGMEDHDLYDLSNTPGLNLSCAMEGHDPCDLSNTPGLIASLAPCAHLPHANK